MCASPVRGHFYPLSGHSSGPFYVALCTAQVTQAAYGALIPLLGQFSVQMTEPFSFSETYGEQALQPTVTPGLI